LRQLQRNRKSFDNPFQPEKQVAPRSLDAHSRDRRLPPVQRHREVFWASGFLGKGASNVKTITYQSDDVIDAREYLKAIGNVSFYNLLGRMFGNVTASTVTLNYGPKRAQILARILECANAHREFLASCENDPISGMRARRYARDYAPLASLLVQRRALACFAESGTLDGCLDALRAIASERPRVASEEAFAALLAYVIDEYEGFASDGSGAEDSTRESARVELGYGLDITGVRYELEVQA